MVLTKLEIKNKITQEQYNEVTRLATNMYVKSKQKPRWGQCVFNALFEIYPETAIEIKNTAIDPFYIEGRLPQMVLSITK